MVGYVLIKKCTRCVHKFTPILLNKENYTACPTPPIYNWYTYTPLKINSINSL